MFESQESINIAREEMDEIFSDPDTFQLHVVECRSKILKRKYLQAYILGRGDKMFDKPVSFKGRTKDKINQKIFSWVYLEQGAGGAVFLTTWERLNSNPMG